jgi:hypothetical protein
MERRPGGTSGLEMLAATDVRCVSHEEKTNAVAALAAGGEGLACDAGDFVSVGMFASVKYGIDSGLLHPLARLERFGHAILTTFDRF